MTRDEAITKVRKLIQEHGLSIKDFQTSPLKGKKLPPKYFGTNGETWAGRGAKPKWMREQECQTP